MQMKLIGAVFVIAASSSYGFSIASEHKREERYLQALLRALECMCCELEYQMPDLSTLCAAAGKHAGGTVGKILFALAKRLEENNDGNAEMCMNHVLTQYSRLPTRSERHLRQLGSTLGRYSLTGQISILQSAMALCKRDLQSLSQDRDARLRSYRILGFCAGAALVILFI